MGQNFVIKDGSELNKLKSSQSGVFLFQDSVTKATIYQLADGSVIAYPAVGPKGIIAENEQVMIEILKNGFPIKEENPNPFQMDQDRIKHLKEHIGEYLAELSVKLKIKIDVTDTSETYYEQISKAINMIGTEKLYEELFVHIGVFVGEKIKMTKGGEWQLEKNYSYNPYYEPILVGSDKEVYRPWHKLSQIIFKKKKFDFAYYYSLASNGY